jgi:iron-sulfur cluster assembly protein
MSIKLTERAARHVKSYLSARNAAVGLRIGVKPTGCSGYAYVVEPVSRVEADDQVFDTNGVTVVVSADSLRLIAGTEVDYSREGLNEGFKFANPNVKNTCGCGESFSIT